MTKTKALQVCSCVSCGRAFEHVWVGWKQSAPCPACRLEEKVRTLEKQRMRQLQQELSNPSTTCEAALLRLLVLVGEWSEQKTIANWDACVRSIALQAVRYCDAKGWDAGELWGASMTTKRSAAEFDKSKPIALLGRLAAAQLQDALGQPYGLGKATMIVLFEWLRTLYFGNILDEVIYPYHKEGDY
jgi:hypothetical protein